MNPFKKLINRFVNPSMPFALFSISITLISTVGIAVILFLDAPESMATFLYFLFSLASISLGYTVYVIVRLYNLYKKDYNQNPQKRGIVFKYIFDYKFRTFVSGLMKVGIGVFYVVYESYFAVRNSSVWFAALAIYYFVLFAIRVGILLGNRGWQRRESETMMIKTYGACGFSLFVLTLALFGALVQMVRNNAYFVYNGIVIYVSAFYAFYKVIIATKNLITARKQDDLTVQALRDVNLAEAAVSILALQTAMFHSFGAENFNPAIFNLITGIIVCLIIVALGLIMALRARHELKKYRDLLA